MKKIVCFFVVVSIILFAVPVIMAAQSAQSVKGMVVQDDLRFDAVVFLQSSSSDHTQMIYLHALAVRENQILNQRNENGLLFGLSCDAISLVNDIAVNRSENASKMIGRFARAPTVAGNERSERNDAARFFSSG